MRGQYDRNLKSFRMDTTEIKNKITAILDKELPGFYIRVQEYTHFFDKTPQLGIKIAANEYRINQVAGQHPQSVSLMLDIATMELSVQIFGGNGGHRIYLIPDMTNPKEKYLAMASARVPFRTPQKNEKAVLNAIYLFATRYKFLLFENRDRLMYQNYVDYDKLFAI